MARKNLYASIDPNSPEEAVGQTPDWTYNFIDAQMPDTPPAPVAAPQRKFSNPKMKSIADDYLALNEAVSMAPEIEEQKKGIKSLEDLMALEQARPVDTKQDWLRPLLALVDNQTGSKFSQSYQPGESAADRNKVLLAYADKIQGRRGDLSKSIGDLSSKAQMSSMLKTLTKGQGGAGGKLTKGQEQVDKTFAKDYTDFTLNGGAAGVEKNLEQLNDVIGQLSKTDKATGGLIGSIPKGFRDILTPEGAAIQDTIENVVQTSLRQTLGAQFTEKEAIRLMERTYNPKLSEKENAKRVQRTMNEISSMAKAKQAAAEYFEEMGTMTGYKGTLRFKIGDKEYDAAPKTGAATQPKTPSGNAGITSDKVTVMKDGKKFKLPKAQLAQAIAEGYEEVR